MDDDDYSNGSEDYEYQYSDDDDDDDNAEQDDSIPMEVEGDDDDDDDDDAPPARATRSASAGKRSTAAKSPSGSDRRSSGQRARRADNNPNAAPVGGDRSGRKLSGGGMMEMLAGQASSDKAIRMLNSTDLLPIMNRRLKEVTEVLDVPPSAAVALMREHGWAKERLFETYYSDPDKVLKKCGVYDRCRNARKKPPPASGSASTRSSRKRRDCTICYDEDGFSPDEMFGMPCGHEFCRDCWGGFVSVALTNGPACVRQTCPEASCTEIVTEDEVAVVAPDLLPKFRSYQLRNFVESNGMTRWCPGPGCERVAVGAGSGGVFGDAGGEVAECDSCSTSFCLKCGEEPHAPAGCRELARWAEKCKNESETANWILANTKPCPKCSSRIEKNQGCNHMNCQQCKYEFCWICMGDWTAHGANTGGYYRCNKFDPSDDTTDMSDAAKAKRELDRYLHYYKRYHAHAEAQKFAKRQLKETEARMVLLQEQSDNSMWTDVEFLKAANEQLVECRRVLKYTYTFAYYLTIDKEDKAKSMQKERFEYHQEMLERFTENLSELSEKPLGEMDRTDVVNQTRVVKNFVKNILQYVDDGLEEG